MSADSITDILSKLLERKAKIIKEGAALDSLITLYQGLLIEPDGESSRMPAQLDLYRKPTPRAVQAAEVAEAIETARRIIIAEGRPMKRGELVLRLEKKGFHLPGKDKNKVFGTNIWRSGKFRTIDDKGYWPKDVTLSKK